MCSLLVRTSRYLSHHRRHISTTISTLKEESNFEPMRVNEHSKAIASEEYFARKLQEKDEENRKTFTDALDLFNRRDHRKRGVVEFILAALDQMEAFRVHRDLEVYKKLLDVFPKGRYVPENMIQAKFQYFPKHQDCALTVLRKMEEHQVIPDEELGEMLKNIFGFHSGPMKKYFRMIYWMPKFKNLSPWPLPFYLPKDNIELAKLAVERITSVDRLTEISVFDASEIPESVDKTWIVSGMSETQRRILSDLPKHQTLFVEGGFRVWLQKTQITYFVLRGEPVPLPPDPQEDSDDVKSGFKLWMYGEQDSTSSSSLSVHEQEDGTILAVCATGTSSKDSLLSWIRFLQLNNPDMENIPILFSLSSPLGTVIVPSDHDSKAVV